MMHRRAPRLRRTRQTLLLCFAIWALGVAISVLVGLLHRDASPVPSAQAIVVLSGPGAADHMAFGDAADRVTRGVELWQAGAAPVIVLSGSGANPRDGSLPDTVGMRRLARDLGVPDAAMIDEGRSYSTLQNGLYTAALPRIDPAQPILLVTSGYHLARAWASFRWAGFADVRLVTAGTFEPVHMRRYLEEGVKWPFNALRAIVSDAAIALGVPSDTAHAWLG